MKSWGYLVVPLCLGAGAARAQIMTKPSAIQPSHTGSSAAFGQAPSGETRPGKTRPRGTSAETREAAPGLKPPHRP